VLKRGAYPDHSKEAWAAPELNVSQLILAASDDGPICHWLEVGRLL
jgi:hypothetical protein